MVAWVHRFANGFWYRRQRRAVALEAGQYRRLEIFAKGLAIPVLRALAWPCPAKSAALALAIVVAMGGQMSLRLQAVGSHCVSPMSRLSPMAC